MHALRISLAKQTSRVRRSSVFLGLSLTEFWERFALAGLKSMLTLLLIEQVLPHNDEVPGLGGLRNLLGSETDDVGLASQIYGLTTALVYLSIPIGGMIGDLLIGRRPSVLTGGFCMLAGLLLVASLWGFLPGLFLFAFGTGLLKGNLSVEVGKLFEGEAKRRRAYSYYLLFLNLGVICGPLALGAVAFAAGWRSAVLMAAAGVAMAIVTYVLMLGRAALDERTGEPADGVAPQPGQSDSSAPSRTLLLGLAIIAVYLCFAAYGQIGNMVLVWSRHRVDLSIGTWQMPVGWLLAMDGLLTIALIFATQAGFRALQRRGIEIGALSQIALGCVACAAGYSVLAWAEAASGPDTPLIWVVLYLALIDLGIVLVWPSGLSLVTSFAPDRQVGLWVGLFYLHGFFASLWVGFAGRFFDAGQSTGFWLLHSLIACAGAGVALVALLFAIATSGRDYATTTSA
ncbi:MFS transporter [Alteriqipengyuania sp. 357]